MQDLSLAAARAFDAQDPLREFRDRFELPAGRVYLDGNSLGALPKTVLPRLIEVVEQEWGRDLISSWNRHDWINSPCAVGGKVARLIGADADEVIVADSTSVNLFRLVVAALQLAGSRRNVVSESGNFPTDLYVCEGATRLFGKGAALRAVERDQVLDAIDSSTALLLLTHVHYKSGELYPMKDLTAAAHARGALVAWDLSHSAGAVAIDLNGANADFAVGCGYKYLNGGPGAPSFLYVARRHQDRLLNPISGWLGHRAPFDFVDDYAPADGMRRFLSGTPSILANTALDAAVDTLLEAGVEQIAEKAQRLTEFFIELIESRCRGLGLTLASPRQSDRRGSHVSYAHPNGYEVMQALIDASVIGDFRAPDIMRFGFAPLYTRFEDVWLAVDALHSVLLSQRWREPRFAERAAVT